MRTPRRAQRMMRRPREMTTIVAISTQNATRLLTRSEDRSVVSDEGCLTEEGDRGSCRGFPG